MGRTAVDQDMLGISVQLPRLYLDPHVLFAGFVLGPMTGESDQQLRARKGLRRYYEALDRHRAQEVSCQREDRNSVHGGTEND